MYSDAREVSFEYIHNSDRLLITQKQPLSTCNYLFIMMCLQGLKGLFILFFKYSSCRYHVLVIEQYYLYIHKLHRNSKASTLLCISRFDPPILKSVRDL